MYLLRYSKCLKRMYISRAFMDKIRNSWIFCMALSSIERAGGGRGVVCRGRCGGDTKGAAGRSPTALPRPLAAMRCLGGQERYRSWQSHRWCKSTASVSFLAAIVAAVRGLVPLWGRGLQPRAYVPPAEGVYWGDVETKVFGAVQHGDATICICDFQFSSLLMQTPKVSLRARRQANYHLT